LRSSCLERSEAVTGAPHSLQKRDESATKAPQRRHSAIT